MYAFQGELWYFLWKYVKSMPTSRSQASLALAQEEFFGYSISCLQNRNVPLAIILIARGTWSDLDGVEMDRASWRGYMTEDT